MRYGGKKDSDMRHGYFLNSSCDMVEKKNRDMRQRHLKKLTCDIRTPRQGLHDYTINFNMYIKFRIIWNSIL